MPINSEKIENLLNLALQATPDEREKSRDLEVGFDAANQTWQVIVRFVDGTKGIEQLLLDNLGEAADEIGYIELSGDYAILEIPEREIEAVARIPQVVYMEKPKRLFFSVNNGKRVSCISAVSGGTRLNLTGKDVILAVIDSGIDYAHPDFRNSDGTTRILELWDQTIENGVFSREQINKALSFSNERERYEVCPSRDISGHGTHVAGICGGNGRASNGRYRGVAYESEFLIVKLGTPDANSFPRTTELMTAVDFCINRAIFYGKPVAINLSFGNNYGSHSGTSLVESFLNEMSDRWRCSVVAGTGNEGAMALHTAGVIRKSQTEVVEFVVSEYETTLNLQIWKNYVDEFAVALIAPSGRRVGVIEARQGIARLVAENTDILVYYGEPSPYSIYQEIYLDFLPRNTYIDAGVWRIELIPQKIVAGNYDMWLPTGGVLNLGTNFLLPREDTTLTIPSTAAKVITVGAYDGLNNTAASFSGRGYTRESNQVKPDLVAPGVDIISAAPGGGYVRRTGTSMATPFVTGSAALLMQWGIIEENDRYLYGEKLKAYLQRGAKPLPGFATYPNPQVGWGALCVAGSIPND